MPKHSTASTSTADRLTVAVRFCAYRYYGIPIEGTIVHEEDEYGIEFQRYIPDKLSRLAKLELKLEETKDIWKEYPRPENKIEMDKITANTTKHWVLNNLVVTLAAG